MKKSLTLSLTVTALFVCSSVSAQSLNSILSKVESVVNSVTGSSTATSVEGTWSYTGPAVDLESDNVLTNVAGTAASSTLESQLSEQLEKVGITEGKMTFTFNADSTFTATVSSKNVSGTYTYDSSAEEMKLKFSKVVNITAQVNLTSTQLDLLFSADKLLTVISAISSKTSSSTLSTISSLASNYDGVNLGFELTKQ